MHFAIFNIKQKFCLKFSLSDAYEIHMATFWTSSCTSSFLCIHYNIFSLKCNTKKENSIFHTFMILHFFQTCIETSSHIPYFELFKKSVFIFCARAYMQMQNWTKIYRCNVEKFALKTGIFFTKKKRFCTYYSEIRGLCSTKCSID